MQGASRESLASLRETLGEQTGSAGAAALAALSQELFGVVSLLAAQGALRRTLSDPGLEPDNKVRVVDTLFGERLAAPALELLRQTARLRWSAPRDIVDALEAMAVEAALQQAEVEGNLDEVEDELFRFERIIDGQPELRAAVTDRNLPAEVKTELLHRLLDGRVADVSYALVERAVLAPRGRTVERVLDEFTELAAKRRERLIARVTTATALTPEQQDSLAAALGREFNRDVRLQLVVDPDLIGGVTVRIGDEVIDGSVLRHLGAAHRRLTGGSGLRT
ncbi:MAG: F-type H+-transporting ATPase subunit delta [Frankiaceae bacterium]|jgi:F-type H+-transporting ATPase subunit delta|nr:F-type H+-transporting ATPase subunit delta [Frankiaceae bacterium]